MFSLLGRMTAFIAVLAAPTVIVAPASATTFQGQINDPIENPRERSRDVTRIVTSFDNATGGWSSSVTFVSAPTPASSARLNLALVPPRGECPSGLGNLLLLIDTDGSRSQYSQACRPPASQPIATPAVVRTVSDAGRTLTYDVTDPSTIGLDPGNLNTARLSQRNEVFDFVPGTTLFSSTAPATLRIGPATRFRVGSTGKLALPISGVSRRAPAVMTLRTASGSTIARRVFTAKPGLAKLRFQLSRAARQKISRGGTRVVLQTSLTDSSRPTRRISQRLTLIR